MLTLVNLEKGSKMVANFGAMFPWKEGEVVEKDGDLLKVKWEDGEFQVLAMSDVKFGRSPNGSPVGVFPEEVFMKM